VRFVILFETETFCFFLSRSFKLNLFDIATRISLPSPSSSRHSIKSIGGDFYPLSIKTIYLFFQIKKTKVHQVEVWITDFITLRKPSCPESWRHKSQRRRDDFGWFFLFTLKFFFLIVLKYEIDTQSDRQCNGKTEGELIGLLVKCACAYSCCAVRDCIVEEEEETWMRLSWPWMREGRTTNELRSSYKRAFLPKGEVGWKLCLEPKGNSTFMSNLYKDILEEIQPVKERNVFWLIVFFDIFSVGTHLTLNQRVVSLYLGLTLQVWITSDTWLPQ